MTKIHMIARAFKESKFRFLKVLDTQVSSTLSISIEYSKYRYRILVLVSVSLFFVWGAKKIAAV